MTTFTLDDDAEAELVAAGDWYFANGRPGVAARFRDAIERALSELGETPDAFQVVEEWRGIALRRVSPATRSRPRQVGQTRTSTSNVRLNQFTFPGNILLDPTST